MTWVSCSGARPFESVWWQETCSNPPSAPLTAAAFGWSVRSEPGVGIRALAGLLVAVDVDLSRLETVSGDQRNLVVGVEHWFGGWLGIRGGARFNLEDDDPQIVGAFGLSLALTPGMYLDGQVTRGRESVERGRGIAGRVGF